MTKVKKDREKEWKTGTKKERKRKTERRKERKKADRKGKKRGDRGQLKSVQKRERNSSVEDAFSTSFFAFCPSL